MTVNDIIKKYGFDHGTLAEKMGVTRANISNTLRRGTMTPRTLHRIADAIGCDYSELEEVAMPSSSSDDETPLYPEGTIDLGYVTLNGRQYRQLFVPAMT